MKKSMPEYIKALSDDKFEILQEIFENKYFKFLQLYWLIRQYSDYISSLKYKSTKKDKLKINMTLNELDIEEVMNDLRIDIEDKDNILVWNEENIIHIEITKDESVPV